MLLAGKGRGLLEILEQGVLKHVLRLRALVEVGAGQAEHRVPVLPQGPGRIGDQRGLPLLRPAGQQRPQPGQQAGPGPQYAFHSLTPFTWNTNGGPDPLQKNFFFFCSGFPAPLCMGQSGPRARQTERMILMKKLHSRGLALLTAAALSLSALGTAAGAAGEGALPLTVNGAETGITVTEEDGGYIVPLRPWRSIWAIPWHGTGRTAPSP